MDYRNMLVNEIIGNRPDPQLMYAGIPTLKSVAKELAQ